MSTDGKFQQLTHCIHYSGESGSGKTLSKRLLIRNLCDLGRAPDARKKSKEHSNILKVDTVLSAFAHASTPFNPDATCVLPYMEIQYDGDGKVVGMKLIDYLLDKSRVTGPADGGRSFHIFHDLFEDLTREEKEELGLTDPAHFTYMAGTMRTTGPSERVAALVELRDDLKALGIGRRLQASLFKLIVGILHLGNVTFETSGKEGESCIIKNPQKLEIVAQILEVPLAVLQDVLIFKMKKIGRDTVSTFLDVEEAMGQRDALARALYLALFSWLMEKINEKLCKPESEWVNFVSVLDLPGMAGIDVAGNGFQRLLINYANERLHYLAIETLIGDWRNRYLKERINVYTPRITITRTVLDLLTSPRTGVLSVIHSATAKGATDETIIAKIVAGNEESASFANLTARSPFAFGIRHYSGTVDYDCRGFSETDADVLQGDFVTLIRGSPEHPGTNSAFLRSLFSDRLVATTTSAHDSSVVVAASNKLARYPSMKRKKDVSAVDENVDVSSTVGHQV